MHQITHEILQDLLNRYEFKGIDIGMLVNKLHQIYWQAKFVSELERSRFFDALFEIEQVVASHVGELDNLGLRDLEIIEQAIGVLRTF